MTPRDAHEVCAPPSGRTIRREVLVRHQNQWCPGKLRAWQESREGEVLGLVTWNPVPGEIRIDRFPQQEIRQL